MMDNPSVGESKETAPGETPSRGASVMDYATMIACSRDFPECRTPEKAAVRILAGREMGIGPVASVLGIRIKEGRMSMDAGLMAGAIKRSTRYDYRVIEHTATTCNLEFTDSKEVVGRSEFTAEDAKRANLLGKLTWQQFPRNMYFARALSNGARWYCPGIFGGAVYSHEELGYQVDEDGRAATEDLGAVGNDLCTKDQRVEIMRLAGVIGKPMPEVMNELGVRLLDELSGYEAVRFIKKMERRAAQATKHVEAGGTSSVANSGPAGDIAGPAPAATTLDRNGQTVPCDCPLTPGQEMLHEAVGEANQPSTPDQHQRIIDLAERLEPDPAMCEEWLRAVLARRNCQKVRQLNHLKAASLIADMESRLADAGTTPPFVPEGMSSAIATGSA